MVGETQDDFNLSEVVSGVFVHHGRHAGLEHADRADSANIGFIIGNGCVAVIDSGGSVDIGVKLLTAIRERTKVRICYVINTHAHFDHILGNAAFLSEQPKFIGHVNLATAINNSRDYFAKNFSAELGDRGGAGVIGPDTLVEAELVLDLGGRELRLAAQPMAHTDSDLTVVDLQTNTLWSGDLVFMERLPVLDGNLRGWLAWMTTSAARSYDRVIPGHGPTTAPWPAALLAQQAYLTSLVATVKSALAAGEFLEDVTASGENALLPGWEIPTAHTRNLSRAYREYEWE